MRKNDRVMVVAPTNMYRGKVGKVLKIFRNEFMRFLVDIRGKKCRFCAEDIVRVA